MTHRIIESAFLRQFAGTDVPRHGGDPVGDAALFRLLRGQLERTRERLVDARRLRPREEPFPRRGPAAPHDVSSFW
ncbi:MAG: hypothetical protein NVV63_03560 [Opitutus sp.]|nr:hypothetical protein [Opitutus sp.]